MTISVVFSLQLLVLGKSFSGVGRRLLLCHGNFSKWRLLSHTEDVTSALLSPGLVVASLVTSVLRVWRLGRAGGVGECQEFSLEAGLQLRVQGDSLYLLTREGGLLVFHLVLGRVTRQILPPQAGRFLTFDVERGLLAGGCTDRHVHVVSLVENKLVHRLRPGAGLPAAGCLVLARPLLVSAGEAGIDVFHVRRGQLLHRLTSGPGRLCSLLVRSDIIIAGDVRGNVLKWDLTEQTAVEAETLTTMSDAIRGIHLNNSSLTAVSFDASCLVWNFW